MSKYDVIWTSFQLWRDNLLFTTNAPEGTGTHLIDLVRMIHKVDFVQKVASNFPD